MNAVDFLISEHNHHKKLLEECILSPAPYPELRSELIHHVNIEETILYPALMSLNFLGTKINDVWKDHNELMSLIQSLDGFAPFGAHWQKKFSELKKLHLEHIADEENDLFPKIRSLVAEAVLSDLADKLIAQKRSISSSGILYPAIPGHHTAPPRPL